MIGETQPRTSKWLRGEVTVRTPPKECGTLTGWCNYSAQHFSETNARNFVAMWGFWSIWPEFKKNGPLPQGWRLHLNNYNSEPKSQSSGILCDSLQEQTKKEAMCCVRKRVANWREAGHRLTRSPGQWQVVGTAEEEADATFWHYPHSFKPKTYSSLPLLWLKG